MKAKAMDRQIVDSNGYVTVEGNPISKEGVYDYLGSQLPGTNPEDATKIFKVYRPAEELMHPECIESFKMIPFIDDHTWLGEEGTDPGDMPLSGMTGEKVYWDAPYLRANIRWYSQAMKEAIESGKKELSPAYRYDVYAQSGVFEDQPYQYTQRNIRGGNHLALVDTGRTGHDVAVMDSAIGDNMSLEEIIAAIGKMDDVTKAALCAALKAASAPEGGATEVDDDVPAVDADVETDPAASDKPVDAAAADVDPAKAEDGEETLEQTKAMDSLRAEIKTLRKQVKAQDSGALLAMLATRNTLASRVSVHVGAFAHDSMTTEQVAAYGLDKLGVKVDKGHEVATLKGVLAGLEKAPKATVAFAQDAAVPKPGAVSKAIDDL